MTPEEFMKLKPGDKVRYGDQEFHIQFIEQGFDSDLEVSGTHTVFNNRGQSIKVIDDIVEHILLVSEPKAKHMIRIDLVISGIDVKTKGWGFMEDAIESAVESYGGEITEFNVEALQ